MAMRMKQVSIGFVLAMSGYVVYVLGVTSTFVALGYRPSGLVGALVALPAVLAVWVAVISKIRKVGAQEGIERHVQTEALGFAFLVTILGVVTYALLEAFAQFPPLSMWWVWAYGMGSWGVVSAVLARKYR